MAVRVDRAATRRPQGSGGLHPLLRDWLTHAQSLTARIRARSPSFAVRVLRQGTAPLLPGETGLLPAVRVGHVREVLLLAGGEPVVWARTVLPLRALRGPWRFLGTLGTRPLGERLFTDPAIGRTAFAYLPAHARRRFRFAPARQRHAEVAARRAVLLRHGQQAILTEVLLAGLGRHCGDGQAPAALRC